ncbi:hypothetical protein AAHZ94_33990, partial [Streptomyces sp. HSW2009]
RAVTGALDRPAAGRKVARARASTEARTRALPQVEAGGTRPLPRMADGTSGAVPPPGPAAAAAVEPAEPVTGSAPEPVQPTEDADRTRPLSRRTVGNTGSQLNGGNHRNDGNHRNGGSHGTGGSRGVRGNKGTRGADAEYVRALPRVDEATRLLRRAAPTPPTAPAVHSAHDPSDIRTADAARTADIAHAADTARTAYGRSGVHEAHRMYEAHGGDAGPEPGAGVGPGRGMGRLDVFTDATTHGTRLRGGKRLALAALGVFVLAMAVITGIEWASGGPVSNVWGGDRGGTTFGNSVSRDAGSPVRPGRTPERERPAERDGGPRRDDTGDPRGSRDAAPESTRPGGRGAESNNPQGTSPSPAPTDRKPQPQPPSTGPESPDADRPTTPQRPGTDAPDPDAGATTGTGPTGSQADPGGGAPTGGQPSAQRAPAREG